MDTSFIEPSNNSTVTVESPQGEKSQQQDLWANLQDIVRAKWFPWVAAIAITLCLAFTPFLKTLWATWFLPDGLYSHGPLVPLLSAYIVWDRREKLKQLPVKGSYFALLLLIPVLYVTWMASRTEMKTTGSILFILAVMSSVWFMAGFRWLVATAPAILFLLFGFPVWSQIIDKYTQPLQALSTDMSFQILRLLGMQPYRPDTTTIMLPNFEMNIAAACSGAKLTLALIALTTFFIFIGKNKLWANVVLAVIVVPLCLLVNGARIASIGVVGNAFGHDAGMKYHDYGGYLELLLCFYLLRLILRALEPKS